MTTQAPSQVTVAPQSTGLAKQAKLLWVDGSGGSNVITFDGVMKESWPDMGADVTEDPVEEGADITDHVKVRTIRCELQIVATNHPVSANMFDSPTLQSLQLSLPNPQRPPGDGLITVTEWVSPGAALGAINAVTSGALGVVAGGAIAVASRLPGGPMTFPLPTSAGQPASAGSTTVTAQTLQFSSQQDFVERMIALLIALKDAVTIFTVDGSKQVADHMVIDELSYDRTFDSGCGASISIGLKEIRIVTTDTVAAPIPALPRAQPPTNGGEQNPKDADPATQTDVATFLINQAKAYFTGGGA